jgi:hypothetical protein
MIIKAAALRLLARAQNLDTVQSSGEFEAADKLKT